MNQATAYLALVFISTLLVSVFYWRIAHKVVMRRILYRLFARRDYLRRMAIDGSENINEPLYQEVEGFICKTISVVASISLASFIWFYLKKSDNVDSSQSETNKTEFSTELMHVLDKTAKDALTIMFLNSPILFLFGFLISILMWVIGRFNKRFIYKQAEHFVEELPSGKIIPAT